MLKLNLQRFAEGEEDESQQLPDPNEIFSFNDNVFYDEEGNVIKDNPDESSQEQQQQTEEPPATQTEEETPAQTETAKTKQTQTPEENAKFAEQRRQQQEAERQAAIRAEAERIANERLANSHEAQVARQLEQIYGMPIDQLAAQMQQAQLQKQSEESGVPVQVLQQQQQMQQQIEQLNQRATKAEFDNWFASKQAEKADVMQRYPMLDEADVNAAIGATLSQFNNHQMPLEQAVLAMHGAKVVAGIQEQARQNALAEISGREKGPLSPQGNRTSNETPTLSAEEKSMAQKMGVSEKDYLLWKDKYTL